MDILLLYLSGISLAIGTAALLVGGVGLIRLPDMFSRIHAAGMIDTAGVGFMILGMMLYEGFSLISIKLAAVAVFLFFTSPIASHAVAQVAHRSGFSPTSQDTKKPKPKLKSKPRTKKAAAKKSPAKKRPAKKGAAS